MSAFWQVVSREFAARKMVLWAGLAVALLAVVTPYFTSGTGTNAADGRAFVTVFLGVALATGSALLVGASLVGTDLSERRIGFYYSRPISAAALWWGKVAGGFAAVLLGVAASMLPNLLPGKSSFLTRWGIEFALDSGRIALFLLFVLVASAVASVALRSHTLWLVADVAALGIASILLWMAFRKLEFFAAGRAVEVGLWVVVGALFASLLAGGWALVAVGRTDLERAHRTLSLTVWPIVLSAVLAVGAWTLWAASYGPRDLQNAYVNASSGGQVTVLTGHVRGRGDVFYGGGLFVPSSGRFIRLPFRSAWSAACSRDEHRAVWLETDGVFTWSTTTLMSLDLTSPGAKPVATPLTFPKFPSAPRIVLSPDGRLVAAVTDGGGLAVYDLSSGRIAYSTRLDQMPYRSIFFETPGRILILTPSRVQRSFSAQILDIPSKVLEPAVTVGPLFAGGGRPRLSPDGERFLYGQSKGGGLLLLDRRTGSVLATLAPETPVGERPTNARFLNDGRVVAVRHRPDGAALAVFSTTGVEERTIPLKSQGAMLGAEIVPGKLAVSLRSEQGTDRRQRRIFIFDVATGTTTEAPKGLTLPIAAFPSTLDDAGQPLPGTLATRLFRDGQDQIQLLDPATGKVTPFPPGAR